MASTWLATVVVTLLLLALHSPIPSVAQQRVGYQYVQSTVDGEASIFLNLWGTLGGCGGGTSDYLYVEVAGGSIMGQLAEYPLANSLERVPGSAGTNIAPQPAAYLQSDNCVSLTSLNSTLDRTGLGLVHSPTNSLAYWILYNAADSASSPDNYTLVTAQRVSIRQVNATLRESRLQPPLLVPLTGSTAGPSVGLLFNGGFEQRLAAEVINASRDMAAGWTGNYWPSTGPVRAHEGVVVEEGEGCDALNWSTGAGKEDSV